MTFFIGLLVYWFNFTILYYTILYYTIFTYR
jgi:hypothetical protein